MNKIGMIGLVGLGAIAWSSVFGGDAPTIDVAFETQQVVPRQIPMPTGSCAQVGIYLTASNLPPGETFDSFSMEIEASSPESLNVFHTLAGAEVADFGPTPGPGLTDPPALPAESPCDAETTFNRQVFRKPEVALNAGSADPQMTTVSVESNRPAPNFLVTTLSISNPGGLIPEAGLDRVLVAVLTYEIRSSVAATELPRGPVLGVFASIASISSNESDVQFFSFIEAQVARGESDIINAQGFEGNGEPATYAYRSLPYEDVFGRYMFGGELTGTVTFQPALEPDRASYGVAGRIVDYDFSDGVQTLTPANSFVVGATVGTSVDGLPSEYTITIWQPQMPMGGDLISGIDLFLVPAFNQFRDNAFIDSPCPGNSSDPCTGGVSTGGGTDSAVTAGSGRWEFVTDD